MVEKCSLVNRIVYNFMLSFYFILLCFAILFIYLSESHQINQYTPYFAQTQCRNDNALVRSLFGFARKIHIIFNNPALRCVFFLFFLSLLFDF